MMFRRTRRAIVCPTCGGLTNSDARTCLLCGRRNPGLWGLSGPLSTLFRRWDFTNAITVACVGLYVLSLVIDPGAVLHPRGPFDVFSPTPGALWTLGAAGTIPWHSGAWWTLVTAIYLHGNLLHILFNVLWIRQLGPAVEQLYGAARLVSIFTISGVAGFAVSNAMGVPFTVGASGSIFGLLGAMVAYGRRRGGAFGSLVLRQYGQWALILFVFGFLMSGVNNFAHAGGFVGGFAAGLVFAMAERRAESGVDRLLAVGHIGLTVLAFGLALWAAVR
jgi:rhomboid protease GluP